MGVQMALLAGEVSLFDMNSWWWAITKGLYWVIEAIQQAYGYLVGTEVISNNAGSTAPEEIQDILFMNITDSRIQRIFLIFFIVAAGLLLIFLAIGMIKACFQNDDQLASRGKMVEKSFSAFFVMLLLPIIMYIGVVATGAFLRLVNGVMANSLSSADSSIAENIHQICLPSPNNSLTWDSSYNTLKSQGANDDYQYVLAMLSSGILIYVLIAICTSLVERLIEIVFFYLIAPFVLARTPLDDGGSYKLWKDIVIAKMLAAAGIIISMYLYIILLQNINTWFTPASNDPAKVAKNMVRILFTIGGAFAVKKGSLSIAQVISQNTGISEGMSQGQSLHLLSSGLGLGMSVLRGGAMGLSLARQSGRGAGTGALQGLTANSGRAATTASTGDALGRSMGTGGGTPGASAMAMTAGTAGLNGAANARGGTFGGGSIGGGGGGSVATAAPAPVADNTAAFTTGLPSNITGGDGLADGAAAGGAEAPNSGEAWTNSLLNNPNMDGEIGKMNAARQAGGGLGTAFLYGGGLIGGIVSAGAYVGGKALGLVTKPIKAAGRKISGAVKNSAPVQTAGVRLRAFKENRSQAKTEKSSSKLNAQLDKSLQSVEARSAAIDKKYGSESGKGYNTEQLNQIKRAQLSGQIRAIDRKVKRLTNAGAANQNVLDRFNKMMNTEYKNSERSTPTGTGSTPNGGNT